MENPIHNWCFTLNNYCVEDLKFLETIDIEFIVYGKELCPTTKTPHLQGYVELKTKKRLSTLKAQWGKSYHFEPRKGSQEAAFTYCLKDGDYIIRGTMKKQGRRSDLDKVRTIALDSGMREITARFNLQQIKVAQNFLTYNETERDWKPAVTWIWGPSGSGKSKRAYEDARKIGDNIYTKSGMGKWWEGYDGHEIVILDDYRDTWWELTEMLTLLDRYPKRIEVKGGSRQFLAKHIIITSIRPPNGIHMSGLEPEIQLLRRIDVTIRLVPDVPEVEKGNTICQFLDRL